MWPHTKVSETLGIKYPILQAGMAGGVTTPQLVAAVSNAGGLGTLGAGYMSPLADSNRHSRNPPLDHTPVCCQLVHTDRANRFNRNN